MAERSLLDHLMLPLARAHAWHASNRFLRATRCVVEVQNRVLLAKVRANADSAYGKDFGFAGIRSYADFASQVPVSTYEDLRPYVERVKAGEVSAMFGRRQRVLMFALTSGSTDEPKYVPVTKAFLRNYRRGWNVFGVRAMSDHPGSFLRHIVQVSSRMDEHHAPSGVPCGAITGIMAATQKRLVRKYYAAPRSVARIPDADARYYTIMRLAIPKDVSFMVTANPATQLKLARAADGAAEQIIRDIRDGTLNARMPIPPELRGELEARLRPDPTTSRRLEALRARSGRLLPRDYWHLAFLANWTGGTLGLYLQQFPEYFGETPVRDVGLLASEGRMSIPIADGTPAGVLDVCGNFFEFIPAEDADSPTPMVFRAHELAAGRDYELLLTTDAGFYRYRIGDVVRVTGFLGPTPLIEFLHKGVNSCSLTGEKLTEQQAVIAFGRVQRELRFAAAHFVLAPHWADPPYYVLHAEEPCPASAANRMDASLRAVNIEYESKRSSRRLGPVRLNLLPIGFLAARHAALSTAHRAANEQYKPRYLFRTPGEDAEFSRARQVSPTAI
jgi:hypothetical protein